MIKRIKNKKLIWLTPVFVLIIFTFSAAKAHAGWLDIGGIATDAIGGVALYLNGLLIGILGNFLALVAKLLGSFLKLQGGYFESISIVKNSWAVFRDFSNMFFILILIIIAFGTILNLEKYNWKGLMVRFIAAALLINFSLAIGGFFIKISTTLSNVALNQFTDITSNLAAGFGLNKLISNSGAAWAQAQSTGGNATANLLSGALISNVGTLILTLIVLCAFVSAFAFSVARVPVLWALLIVSPIAWIAVVMPQTKRIWDDWWKWFFCWTFFMPVYLFSLVLGIGILSNRPDIETAINLGTTGNLAADAANFIGFTVQDIFFYVLTILIMVGALAFSIKIACAGGTYVGKTMGFITGKINKFAKDSTGYNAWKKKLTEKAEEKLDTGLSGRWSKLYGGERANRLREARVAGILGNKGALSEAEAAEAKKNYDKYKSQGLDKDKAGLDALNAQALAGKLNKYEILALRKLRAENGWIAPGVNGETEIEATIREAGVDSKFAQEYIAALEKNGFEEAIGGRDQAEAFATRTSLLPLKQALMKSLVKNNGVLTKDFAKDILDIFSMESKEVKDGIEKELQKNIKNFTETRTKGDRKEALTDRTSAKFIADDRIRRLLALQMLEDDEINSYPKFKEAEELFGINNQKSREMRTKISDKDKITFAEIETREDRRVNKPNPATPLASADVQILADKYDATIKKMKDAKTIAEIDTDKWKEQPLLFQRALQKKIDTLEIARPTTPAYTNSAGKRIREVPGAGKSFLQSLQKSTINSPDKIAIIKNLTA